ncbi:MAG: hypothetical protein ABI442_03665, partial [Gemmatimonadaceae bacterium]
RMIMPTDMAMTWEFPIHLFLCGLVTYLFLRAWRFGYYSALIGGLAYMMGGSIAGTASPGHDGKLFVSAMLPLILLLLTRGSRDGRLWAWGGAALTIGLAVLSPHPQALQYLLLVAGAFALYVAFANHPGFPPLPRNTALARLGLAAAAVGVGMLMGAVQYMPVLFEYIKASPRAGGHDLATAQSYSFPIEETLNAYLPQFSGILDRYWGRNGIHFHSDYFGAVVLVLFGAAFGESDQKNFRRFWIGVGVVSLLWAFGGNTPFFQLILAVVPGTKYFRAPSVIIYVTAFAVSVLAAIGAERILSKRVSPRYAVAWGIAAAVVALLMSVGGYTAIAGMVLNTMTSQYPPQYISLFSDKSAANTGAAILGAWRSFAFVLLAAGCIWAFLNDRITPRVAAIALAVLVTVDLWSIERLYWQFSPRASVLYASDPAIDAIRKSETQTGKMGRVLVFPAGPGLVGRDPAFSGNALWSHDLRVVRGYHGNELGRYQRVVGPDADSNSTPLLPQFWRHENVRYMYTGLDPSTMSRLDSTLKLDGHITTIAGPVRDAAGSMVYSYELPGDNPTAWVATSMAKAGDDQAFATILDPRFDPARVAIFDSSATVTAPALQGLPEPAAQHATVTAAPAGAYDISLDQPSTAGEALVVSDNYFPGWQATVNGAPAVVARTDFNLIGVVLPAGAKTVQLRFVDAAYERGKVFTWAAILLAIVMLAGGFVADRRNRGTTAPA